MSLGDNIKEYRKKANLTQEELARKIGVSKSFMSKIEINNKAPSFEVLLKIAKALNVLATDLNPNLKKDNFINGVSIPGLYSPPKDTSIISEFLNREPTTFTENEIIEMLICDYNDNIFNKKYDIEKINEKHIEELKPIIHGIIEMVLKNCAKNK
ncbi:helix-turn-helix domain-containing protein [Clostridium beijerinckii]|uniref:helix-turn-helix domain-containing protein n=1 Tax=Clostridium beijerinckii TaxID=1520 RepID=UPI0005A31D85|nr:helix-turn-helix transcriptional regulator [Clostridium beijerinckii]